MIVLIAKYYLNDAADLPGIVTALTAMAGEVAANEPGCALTTGDDASGGCGMAQTRAHGIVVNPLVRRPKRRSSVSSRAMISG